MLLCLDIGNSHIFGGVFDHNTILLRFRLSSCLMTADELGMLLKTVLRDNAYNPDLLQAIAICSVVPQLKYVLHQACEQYFAITPYYLCSDMHMDLYIQYDMPQELGIDRIANSIAAIQLYPNQPLIVIDYGTAMTFNVINAEQQYLGGAIMPGMRLMRDALSNHTAQLPWVDLVSPSIVVGKNTVANIQSGIFYSMVGAAKEMLQQITREVFVNVTPTILATGGFAHLFAQQAIYDYLLPDLILHGIYFAWQINRSD